MTKPVAPPGPSVVAYLSMEVGLEPAMPTYSGGLGILAGDTLRAAADIGIRLVGVSLLHRSGYFRQHLDEYGNQTESPVVWSPEQLLEPMGPQAVVTIEGREVRIQAWRYLVRGRSEYQVPVYFLDTDLPANSGWDRSLTGELYGEDSHYRLCQEVILGVGGVAMLRALGCRVRAYHMNEGHSALLTLALLEEQTWGKGLANASDSDHDKVRQRCVFTTHTPVPAGQDRYPLEMVRKVLGEERANALCDAKTCIDGEINMTNLALVFSRYINGVSMRHEEVSRTMFPNYPVNSITNGVHAGTWISGPFQKLYDSRIPEWRRDTLYLRYAISIPLEEIQAAHVTAKGALLDEVQKRAGVRLSPSAMTIGFARRATPYKRADLLFSNIERLRRMVRRHGPLQVIYGGKAHPRDEGGKELIRRVFEAAEELAPLVKVIYLEEYDMALAKYLCSGVDLWLNTPKKPEEASGTSGMKAAMNGIPSLSVLDGWWIEGHFEGITGWAIGDSSKPESDPVAEARSMYDKLEYVILPMFYNDPEGYASVMRSAIAINASYYNAERMLYQYYRNAYGGPVRPDNV
ncbi:MAG: alpha-glucan family phosphorylase [Chloroflexota bacterium]